MVLGLASCAGDVDEPEAQPAPDTAEFAEGQFDALPVPPHADPVGPRTEDRDVVARSFTVRGSTPGEVVEFYATALDGWDHEDTTDVGTALRSDFTRDGRALRVTAQPAPAVERDPVDGDEAVVQLSLQLGPPASVLTG